MSQQSRSGSRPHFDRVLDVVRMYVASSTQSPATRDLTARLIARRVQQELCGRLGIKRYEVDPLHLSFSGEFLRRRCCVALVILKDTTDPRIWQKYFSDHDAQALIPRLYLREPTAAAQFLFPHCLPTDCDLEDLAQALIVLVEQLETPTHTVQNVT